jgi:hypothetical protein
VDYGKGSVFRVAVELARCEGPEGTRVYRCVHRLSDGNMG